MRNKFKTLLLLSIYIGALFVFGTFVYQVCKEPGCELVKSDQLLTGLDGYQDSHLPTLMDKLRYRVSVQPFNLVALALFAGAIAHTFFAHSFIALSHKIRDRRIHLNQEPTDSFLVEVLHFFGEVEVIFGLWVIPLFFSIAYFFDWNTALHYLDDIHYTEPMFVVVIMTIAASRPIVNLAEDCLNAIAKIGQGKASIWWLTILTVGPISGSLITEPGAMTISALLLAKQFYRYRPSKRFAYATLGLLFTNISVGGVLTNFAAPPVLMVSKAWGWSTQHMLYTYGWKAVIGIVLANCIYFLFFKKEFAQIDQQREEAGDQSKEGEGREVPFGVSIVHVSFLAWTVVTSHFPVVFIGAFLLYLGFHQATRPYQNRLELKSPILVGFFLAGLVVHGTLQAWWIAPLLSNMGEGALLVMAGFLTSFNDNAEITFLASLIPTFDDTLKYAVVAGAVTGGGLTVIANAPNPAGESILGKYFENGISAIFLLLGALIPTLIIGTCFWLLR